MSRWIPLLPLLAGCPPTPEDFPDRFADRWCEAAEPCSVDQLTETCRSSGGPPDPIDPQVTCRFRQPRATACLTSTAWACSGAAPEVEVTVPDVCATVYACEE